MKCGDGIQKKEFHSEIGTFVVWKYKDRVIYRHPKSLDNEWEDITEGCSAMNSIDDIMEAVVEMAVDKHNFRQSMTLWQKIKEKYWEYFIKE